MARSTTPRRPSLKVLALLAAAAALSILIIKKGSSSSSSSSSSSKVILQDHDCYSSPQAWPVFANKVENVDHGFFISIADLGSVDRPNRNFQRMIKGKLFQKPEISGTIQAILAKLSSNKDGIVIDVGANVGMATFAAAAMGFKVLAFEPVEDNVRKLCDGVYLNRAADLVRIFHAAVSDSPGNTTLHKVVGRLDNTAVSLSGAKLAFKSKPVVAFTVPAVTLDSVISPGTSVALLKIDVQGWEYHVLRGAQELLSRPPERAPYLVFEEDEALLQASNSTSRQIHELLQKVGYTSCSKIGNDRHCSKV